MIDTKERPRTNCHSKVWKRVGLSIAVLIPLATVTNEWLLPKLQAELRKEWKAEIKESEDRSKPQIDRIDRRLERIEDSLQRIWERLR